MCVMKPDIHKTKFMHSFSDIDFVSLEISLKIRKKITLTFLNKMCKLYNRLKVNGGFYISTKESIIWLGGMYLYKHKKCAYEDCEDTFLMIMYVLKIKLNLVQQKAKLHEHARLIQFDLVVRFSYFCEQ